MTTRSGKNYSRLTEDEERPTAEKMTTVDQLIQVLMEDRQQRERAITEERRRRDEEMQRRDLELWEEPEKRDEEARNREKQYQEQFTSLQTLVAGVAGRSEGRAIAGRREAEWQVKVSKLSDSDDIETYLTTFERLI